jgi:late competence protein required for DNA uptake (superfamily II DNA/RNA helicase)
MNKLNETKKVKVTCKGNCKPCKQSSVIFSDTPHVIYYCYECKKYGVRGDTFKELYAEAIEETKRINLFIDIDNGEV